MKRRNAGKRRRIILAAVLIILALAISLFTYKTNHRAMAEQSAPWSDSEPTPTESPVISPEPAAEESTEPAEETESPNADYVTPIPQDEPTQTPSPKATVKAPPPLTEEQKIEREKNRKELAKKIDAYVKNDPEWKRARLGICIETVLRGDEVYSYKPNLPLIPASNLKIVTTATALAKMGPEYRFKTELWGREAVDGVMSGNIYLRGLGDPTYMTPYTNHPAHVLHEFARVLKKRGVKVIEGDVVGDDSAFDREFLGRGWKARYLMYDYAAPAGALSINGNCVKLIVDKGKVSMQPGNRYMQILYNSKKNQRVAVSRKPGTDVVKVSGYSSRPVHRLLTVNNPSKLTTAVFAEVLRAHGIKVKGKVRLVGTDDLGYREDEGVHKIAFHRSEKMSEIIKEINKESDNVLAQHVFKAIGMKEKGRGTCDNSNAVIREWMKENGIDPSGFAMADGSGLSVYNRITPHQMCELLRMMVRDPNWDHFWSSLSMAGKDGTLKYRMKGVPCRGKTGSLKGHIALCGYVKTKAGQVVVFSMMTNAHKTWSDRIRKNEDYVVTLLSKWDKKL